MSEETLKTEEQPMFLWDYLKSADKPIVMYGMGDGAVKIMEVMEKQVIKPAEFMASDEFVRGHSFMGYTVKKLSEIEEQYDDFIVIVCFGSQLPEVMDRLYAIAEKHELYAPDVPVIGGGLFDKEYAAENMAKIKQVREMLADDISRNTFDNWIRYRYSGNISYLKACEAPRSEAMELLKLGDRETFVDLGAYNGDTVEEFLQLTGKKFTKIYAVEPDARNYGKLRRRHYALGSAIFEPINAIAWSEDRTMDFFQRRGRNSAVSGIKGRNIPTAARSVDSILGGKEATCIKLDVEGCEKEALNGAAGTIGKYRPKLIVSLYHRTEDMLELPLLVKKLNSSYKFYLRHHPYIPGWDTNLYCI